MRKRRVGVMGSFVWDVIHGRDPRDAPVEEWGGITYALGALEAALTPDWEFVPILKVGSDLAQSARQFVAGVERAAPGAAPIEVPHPNNRVVMHYQSDERRCEQLSGGVPGWSWLGLKPLLADLDALYINLISGFELDLETAQLIGQHFRGPIYCDIHSLLLAVQPNGMRTLGPLPTPAAGRRPSRRPLARSARQNCPRSFRGTPGPGIQSDAATSGAQPISRDCSRVISL